jgi:hypothetical protein
MNISFLSLSLSSLQFCNFCNLLATAESATNWKKISYKLSEKNFHQRIEFDDEEGQTPRQTMTLLMQTPSQASNYYEPPHPLVHLSTWPLVGMIPFIRT